jgi:hypothetical protein
MKKNTLKNIPKLNLLIILPKKFGPQKFFALSASDLHYLLVDIG